jgi:hypothetical protein
MQPQPKAKPQPQPSAASSQCERPGCTFPKAKRKDGGVHKHCSVTCRDTNPSYQPAAPSNNIKCFNCGSPGHIVRDCPHPKQMSQLQSFMVQGANGQMFTLTPSQLSGGGTVPAGSTTQSHGQFFGLGAGGTGLMPSSSSHLALTPPESVASNSSSVDARLQELEARNMQLQAQLQHQAAQVQSMSMQRPPGG